MRRTYWYAAMTKDEAQRSIRTFYEAVNLALSPKRGAVYEPGYEKSIRIQVLYIEDLWPSQWKIASPKTRQTFAAAIR